MRVDAPCLLNEMRVHVCEIGFAGSVRQVSQLGQWGARVALRARRPDYGRVGRYQRRMDGGAEAGGVALGCEELKLTGRQGTSRRCQRTSKLAIPQAHIHNTPPRMPVSLHLIPCLMLTTRSLASFTHTSATRSSTAHSALSPRSTDRAPSPSIAAARQKSDTRGLAPTSWLPSTSTPTTTHRAPQSVSITTPAC